MFASVGPWQCLVGTLAIGAAIVGVVGLARSNRAIKIKHANALRDAHRSGLAQSANVIAHEVRNALNGLRMGTDLLVRKYTVLQRAAGVAEGRDERIVDAINREINRLVSFVDDLLMVTKGSTPRTVALDLTALVPKVVDLFTAQAQSRNVTMRVVVPSEASFVQADPLLIHRILATLVKNSLDKSFEPNSQLRDIDVRLTANDDQVRIDVHDNGSEIPTTVRPRLFEPFASSKSNGVGLGLALSQQIARAHGGDLSLVQSSPGAVAFTLTLPRGRK